MSETMTRSLLVMFIAGMALQGCADSIPDRLGAPIEGYSHTSAAINRFSVNGALRIRRRPNVLRHASREMAPRLDRGGRVGERP